MMKSSKFSMIVKEGGKKMSKNCPILFGKSRKQKLRNLWLTTHHESPNYSSSIAVFFIVTILNFEIQLEA